MSTGHAFDTEAFMRNLRRARERTTCTRLVYAHGCGRLSRHRVRENVETRRTREPGILDAIPLSRSMLKRSQWLDLARKLDWELSYVSEQEAFPEVQSGRPWLPHSEWSSWDEPYKTTYAEYVTQQCDK